MGTGGKGCVKSHSHSVEYLWEIDGITSIIESSKSTNNVVQIFSPKFSTNAKMNDSWCLELKMKINNISLETSFISLALKPINQDRPIETKYLIFFLTKENKKVIDGDEVYSRFSNRWKTHLFKDSRIDYSASYVRRPIELLEKKDEFFHNDTFTVGIELVVYDDDNVHYEEYFNSAIKASKHLEHRLVGGFEDLLISKFKCDVVVKVGDEKFEVHKAILGARSCVFEAMFFHDMKEKRENAVTIPNIEPEIFKRVLEYIYTDKVNDLDNFSEELLEVSNKYQLQGLKEMCEGALAKALTIDNSIDMLLLADHYNATLLKESAIIYINKNFVKIKKSEEFEKFRISHLRLLSAVYDEKFGISE